MVQASLVTAAELQVVVVTVLADLAGILRPTQVVVAAVVDFVEVVVAVVM